MDKEFCSYPVGDCVLLETDCKAVQAERDEALRQVAALREVLKSVIKGHFTPTQNGIQVNLSFEQVKKQQEALTDTAELAEQHDAAVRAPLEKQLAALRELLSYCVEELGAAYGFAVVKSSPYHQALINTAEVAKQHDAAQQAKGAEQERARILELIKEVETTPFDDEKLRSGWVSGLRKLEVKITSKFGVIEEPTS